MSEVRVAVVTGATGGIGASVAHELASRGYALALLDTNEDSLAQLVAGIQSTRAIALPGDLTDLAYAETAIRQTIDQLERIDLLVNNAAWREVVTMREITLESWDRTLRVCLTAPAFLARWCATDMERRGRGAIVNVTSIMSQQSAGYCPAYIASKGALDALTHELAALYGPRGIRVVAVAPGAIDTPLSRDLADSDSLPEKKLREFSEGMITLGRWGRPEETAKAIAWIASDEASYVTGTTLVVDGGWMRHHLPTALTKELRPGQF